MEVSEWSSQPSQLNTSFLEPCRCLKGLAGMNIQSEDVNQAKLESCSVSGEI